MGDRVADPGLVHHLNARCEKPDLARPERLDLRRARGEDAESEDVVAPTRRHQLNPVSATKVPFPDSENHDRPVVGIEPTVEDECLQGRVIITRRWRNLADDRLKQLGHAGSNLCTREHRIVGPEADDFLELVLRPLGIGVREIDLVDHRNDREVVVERQIDVSDGLRLDALRGVDHQQRPLAGREAP